MKKWHDSYFNFFRGVSFSFHTIDSTAL